MARCLSRMPDLQLVLIPFCRALAVRTRFEVTRRQHAIRGGKLMLEAERPKSHPPVLVLSVVLGGKNFLRLLFILA
uniref:Uncharacterized protein n=1 Tax=Ixodes ricinus TaxID=34613 RepID=A0A6B0U5I1_IXORI